MRAVTIQECCHICEHYYNAENCPLYRTYNAAADMGDENFEEVAKYQVSCNNFLVNKKYVR